MGGEIGERERGKKKTEKNGERGGEGRGKTHTHRDRGRQRGRQKEEKEIRGRWREERGENGTEKMYDIFSENFFLELVKNHLAITYKK